MAEVNLPRSMSLFDAVMLVVGNVVGAGIFTTSGLLAGEISCPLMFLLVWVIGGLLTLTGALTYAELGAMFPRAGGDYQFLKEAYGSWAGFLVGWLNFWIISPGSIAALSLAIVNYLPGFETAGSDIVAPLTAVCLVLGLSFINYRSTKLATYAQSMITVGSLVLLVALVVGGAIWGRGNWAHFNAAPENPCSLLDIPGSAMIAVLFTYSGWFCASYVGSEVKRPGKYVPLALLLGTLIVSVTYVAINAIYVFALPMEEMAGKTNIAQVAADRLFGPSVGIAVSAAIVLAIASCINATVMTGARICYAMAADGVFFAKLKAVHPVYRTPHVAIAVQAVLAVLLVLLGTFSTLLTSVVFAMLLTSAATGIAHLVLRAKRPTAERPYRTLAAPVIPIVFVAAYGFIAVSVAVSDPKTSLIGLALGLTGVPFFFWWRKRQAKI